MQMLPTIWEVIQSLFGFGRSGGDLNALQMVLRTVLVYAFTLAIVRLGSKRFLSHATAFDTVVGIMLGSIMSRAIDGSSPFFRTLLAGAALVGMHWLIAALSLHFDWLGTLVKGHSILLIKDGKLQTKGLRAARLSEHDLKQALRMQNNHTDPANIKSAHLERSGSISVIPFPNEPQIVDVAIADGVQTVRIELK
jgi:uncharacterized membrane protein YcaP (DUF421 family)